MYKETTLAIVASGGRHNKTLKFPDHAGIGERPADH